MSGIAQIGPAAAQLLSAKTGSGLPIAPVVLIILSLTASGPDNLPMCSIKEPDAEKHSSPSATWLLPWAAVCGDAATLAAPEPSPQQEAVGRALPVYSLYQDSLSLITDPWSCELSLQAPRSASRNGKEWSGRLKAVCAC